MRKKGKVVKNNVLWGVTYPLIVVGEDGKQLLLEDSRRKNYPLKDGDKIEFEDDGKGKEVYNDIFLINLNSIYKPQTNEEKLTEMKEYLSEEAESHG